LVPKRLAYLSGEEKKGWDGLGWASRNTAYKGPRLLPARMIDL